MPIRRRHRFVVGQVAWMSAAIVLFAALGLLSLEVFFVVSLAGFFAVLQFTAPTDVAPRWRSRLRWVAVLGMVGFAYVVADRVLELLAWWGV